MFTQDMILNSIQEARSRLTTYQDMLELATIAKLSMGSDNEFFVIRQSKITGEIETSEDVSHKQLSDPDYTTWGQDYSQRKWVVDGLMLQYRTIDLMLQILARQDNWISSYLWNIRSGVFTKFYSSEFNQITVTLGLEPESVSIGSSESMIALIKRGYYVFHSPYITNDAMIREDFFRVLRETLIACPSGVDDETY